MTVEFPKSFRKTPQTFHELRESLQHVQAFIRAGGAGGMRWIMNPVLPPGSTYEASFNECVRCNSGDTDTGILITVVLPKITEDAGGLMVAIKSVFGSTQVIAAVAQGGDQVEHDEIYHVNAPRGIPQRLNAGVIMVADRFINGWEIIGEWRN